MNVGGQPARGAGHLRAALSTFGRAGTARTSPPEGAPATARRVLVVYQHLPHYRRGVFEALVAADDVAVEFAADVVSRDGSIPTINPDELPVVRRLRNRWFGPFLWQRGLLTLIARGRYDVIIFLGDVRYVSTWVAAFMARVLRCRVLFWTIGWHRPERGATRVIRLACYRIAHQLLLYGERGAKIGTMMGYPAERMTVIYNSLPVEPSDDIDASEPPRWSDVELPTGERPVIGAVIRLNAAKRLDLLIEAAHVLQGRGLDVDVLLVGDGPERERLMTQATTSGVRLHCPGGAYDAASIDLAYGLLRLTVVPANAGLTVLQSLQHGCPVLTHDDEYAQMPETEAIVDGETGGYFVEGDADSLADHIELWLGRLDSDLEGVRARCRSSVVDRWSAQGQVGRILAVLEDEMSRRPGRT